MAEPSNSSSAARSSAPAGGGGGGGGGGTGSTIDSYIGSLISLTSKSEIRYEGVLYTADEKDATIALQSVRSYGTEGRKKDGPQIPPSEKVYEYIIFRASDIKDLLVKSPPPSQTPSQIHSDPAIVSLQSQYSQPSSSSKTFGPSVSGPLPDAPALGGSSAVPSSYRMSTPLFQPPRNLGSWGSAPVPGSGAGLGMPMYWQGYYGPTSGLLPPHMQQQPLQFQSPPGLPIPPGLQPNMHPSVLPSMPTGLSTSSEVNNLQNAPVPQQSVETPTLPSSIPAQSSTFGGTTLSSVTSLPLSSADLITSLPPSGPVASTSLEPNYITAPSASNYVTAPAMSKVVNVSASTSSVQSVPQSIAVSAPLNITTAQPNLVTPGQLLHTGGGSTSLKNKSALKDDDEPEITHLSSQSGNQTSTSSNSQRVANQPLLPLPPSSQPKASNQVNGIIGHSGAHSSGHQRRRGRGGMDRGGRHNASQFDEDFDFTAMNEKFNKDEVWGHLGKSEQRDRDDDGEENGADRIGEEDAVGQASITKPVYVKDEFFDTLSCDALDRSRNERRFSEQRRIDTETFGNITRSRSGRGGRGTGYRGNFRGGYFGGRGNGYGGRGRGGRTYY